MEEKSRAPTEATRGRVERRSARGDQEVASTIYRVGTSEIRRSSLENLTVFSAAGDYQPAIAKEIERLVLSCRGDIGLDLRNLRHPNPTLIPLLEKLKRRAKLRKKAFVLISPPEKVTDLLLLAGVRDEYVIAEAADAVRGAGKGPSHPGHREVEDRKSPPEATISQREIIQFSHSIRRSQRIENSLQTAARRIRSILPLHPPELEGYDLAVTYRPSERIGGDFYDFVRIDEDHLGFTIGDVSGHGIEAAVLMGMVKKITHMRAVEIGAGSPRLVLSQVNRDLAEDLDRYTFITLIYGILDIPSVSFTFARAGHDYPIFYNATRPLEEPVYLRPAGKAIGVARAPEFDESLEDMTIAMSLSDTFLLYTDGFVDSRNHTKAAFGRQRLTEVLRASGPRVPCRQALDLVVERVALFAEGVPQEDDMTGIILRYQGLDPRTRHPGP